MIRLSTGQLSNKVKNKEKNKERINEKINELFQAMCWLSISGKALNLNRLSRARSISPSA